MTLHTRFELTFATESRWIGDSATREIDIPALCCVDMRTTWTVTSLAVDALRRCFRKSRSVSFVIEQGTRIRVVTRHAVFVDRPLKVHVRWAVVAGTHRPDAAVLRVPTQRQLHKSAIAISMKKCPSVIARTDHEICRQLEHVRFSTVKSHLMATLIQNAIALCNRVKAL